MQPSSRVRVKICCIQNLDEVWQAVRAQASAVGLVAEMPSGLGPIPESQIIEIAPRVPPAIGSFLLTSETTTERIIAQHRRCRTNTLQLVDQLTTGTYADLRAALPGIAIVQVIHVTGTESIDEAEAAAVAGADAILLDSGNPKLAVKELGGTGRVHDWQVSRRIREQVPVPVFLAGGLSAGNVGQAITAVQPFGVDVCSGVRTGRWLDPIKLAEFMRAVESFG